jgi:hypothetical protein
VLVVQILIAISAIARLTATPPNLLFAVPLLLLLIVACTYVWAREIGRADRFFLLDLLKGTLDAVECPGQSP